MIPFRKLVLLASSLMIAFGVSAKHIDQQSALQLANEFWTAGAHSRADVALRPLKMSRAESLTCHIFTPESGRGFVIVSDDDCISPILGYSFDESITVIPEQLVALLKGLEPYISANSDRPRRVSRAPSGTEVLWETALWDQGYPFNLECPEVAGNKCLTGCVATALGIVMHYFNWPPKGTGTIEGYTSNTGVEVPSRTLGTPYLWELMPRNANDATEEGKNQIARLLADIGCAQKADYGTGETGAYTDKNVLEKHFGYSKYMYMPDYDYSEQDAVKAKLWEKRVINEVLKHPFPIAVYSPGYDEAHEFVIDGVSADRNYVHANFGWSGAGNGFYTVETLMYNGGYQEIICNMVPDTGDADVDNLLVITDEMICSPDPMTSDEFQVEKVEMFNRFVFSQPDVEFSGVICAAHIDRDHNIKSWCSDPLTFGQDPFMTFRNVNIKVTDPRQIGDKLSFFYKLDGSENWHPIDTDGVHPNEISLSSEGLIRDVTSVDYDRNEHTVQITVDMDDVVFTLTDDSGNAVDALSISYRANQAIIDINSLPETPCYLTIKKETDSVKIKINVKDI